MSAVQIRGLTKIFRTGIRQKRVVALDNLDMTIETGQIVGYLGANGAGKTTTFKLLLGLIRPTAGEAFLLGESIRSIRARNEVGFLPEQPYFYDYLTAYEFLDFYCRLFGQRASTRNKRIKTLLGLVNLSDSASVQLRHFSRGMLQRIGAAQALINDPKLIFLDEPMSGLDPIRRKQMRDLFLRLKGEGKTVLYSTHILPDVEAIADYVAILSNGKLLGFGALSSLLNTQDERVEMNIQDLDVEGVDAIKALATEVIVERDKHLLVHLSGDDVLRQAHQIIVQRKAKLVSLIPRMESLENLFVKLMSNKTEKVETEE